MDILREWSMLFRQVAVSVDSLKISLQNVVPMKTLDKYPFTHHVFYNESHTEASLGLFVT